MDEETTNLSRREVYFDLTALTDAIETAFISLRDSMERIFDGLTHAVSELIAALSVPSVENIMNSILYGLDLTIGRLMRWLMSAPARSNDTSRKNQVSSYDSVILVRFLQLVERLKASVDDFRTTSPRHQDRGSGDADSHNDNFEKECLAYFCGCGKQRSILDRLSLYTRRSSTHAGRRNPGFLRCFDAALL